MILPKGNNTKIDYKMGKFIIDNYPKLSTIFISKKIKITSKQIFRFLKLNKVKTMPQGYFNKGKISKKRLFNKKQENIIINLYKNGKSSVFLSKKFKTSACVIIDYLNRNGVKRRTNHYKGSKWIGTGGYVMMLAPLKYRNLCGNKTKAEHRIVMEIALGRRLLPTEQVDHKNGVRHDNRLENLQLYSTAHGAGQNVQHTIQRSIDDILRLGNEYLTGKHGKVKMNAKYKKQLKQMLGK